MWHEIQSRSSHSWKQNANKTSPNHHMHWISPFLAKKNKEFNCFKPKIKASYYRSLVSLDLHSYISTFLAMTKSQGLGAHFLWLKASNTNTFKLDQLFILTWNVVSRQSLSKEDERFRSLLLTKKWYVHVFVWQIVMCAKWDGDKKLNKDFVT